MPDLDDINTLMKNPKAWIILYRVVLTVGAFLIAYAVLWGDGRYVTKDEFKVFKVEFEKALPGEIETAVWSLKEGLRFHAEEADVHMSLSTKQDNFYTRREAEKLEKDVQAINTKLDWIIDKLSSR